MHEEILFSNLILLPYLYDFAQSSIIIILKIFIIILTNLTITSLRIEATKSLSYSQLYPIYPRETIADFYYLGIFLDKGEIFISFYGKENLPDAMKSKWGTNIILLFIFSSFISWFPSWYDCLGKNLPTNGNSTDIPLTIQF